MSLTPLAQAQRLLKEHYGYDQFRPLQADIIQAVLAKKDVLVLMPTGGGKSVCFQVPALMSEGVCLVISPLIALMKDQVEGLRGNGITAAALNSSITTAEEDAVLQRCRDGEIKLLYISPEKLVVMLPMIKALFPISFVAIDEAHCISSWGHDFRPEYTQLHLIRRQLPGTPVIALTATADKVTRKDILTQLEFTDDSQVFISSFDRPNLSLEVKSGYHKKDKFAEIENFILARENESGIIYCLSRKETEEMADFLVSKNISAACYHAGLESKKRSKVQDDFINDRIQVICATIAFGMGIDKSNVRFIIHNNMPKSIEGYFQEIGRAGRDGVPSDTVLYYSLRDIVLLTQFANDSAQREINIARLKRMQQYAEADICRRKILLNYFGETMEHDCGNCDVCRNPRKFFDGTVIAQKALSGLYRMEEKVGVTMLIDVLRGSSRAELLEKGYHQIKTYAAGKEYSFDQWQQFILQLLHIGVVEIAYDENFSLKITPLGREVLFAKKPVRLAQLPEQVLETPAVKKEKLRKEKQEKVYAKKQLAANDTSPEDDLFQSLRKLRISIAQDNHIPAYMVFSDATLRQMADEIPTEEEDFRGISGVGDYKWQQYGETFLEAIRDYTNKGNSGKRQKGDTYKETLQLYRSGLSPEEIAAKRNLNVTTVFSHLAYLHEKGEDVDVMAFVTVDELKAIKAAVNATGERDKLKPLFDAMNGAIDFHKIRLGLAMLKKIEQANVVDANP